MSHLWQTWQKRREEREEIPRRKTESTDVWSYVLMLNDLQLDLCNSQLSSDNVFPLLLCAQSDPALGYQRLIFITSPAFEDVPTPAMYYIFNRYYNTVILNFKRISFFRRLRYKYIFSRGYECENT